MILPRLILWDLLKVFAITLVGLTGLFVLGGLVAEASQRGLAPAQIVTVIPLMIPGMLPYTMPTATLFAACNVYGRLAKDQEITALRAAGVHLRLILWPTLIFGLLTTSATLALYYDFIPRSFRLVREHLLQDTNEVLYTLLRRNGCIRHAKLPYVIFVRDVRGDRLIDVVFKKRSATAPLYEVVARARWATLRVETGIDSNTGRPIYEIVVAMAHCVLRNEGNKGATEAHLTFGNQEFRERLPSEIFGDKDNPRACEVTWPNLLERIRFLERRYQEKLDEWNREQARPVVTDHDRELRAHRQFACKYALRELRSYQVEVFLRPALAFGCLCFAMLGAPLGIRTNRADFLSSFVIGFLPVVATYYPLMMCGTNLAKDNKLPVLPATWSANLLLGLVAVEMCRRVIRR
ncbi:MAG: LptF/LptG family permease [Gemmataceae bacterium]|nr:LptF/LptG family permease [Gemmataceae bacterium]